MTIEHMEPEPKEPSEEERRESRVKSYRSVASGLIIRASQFLGTFDVAELDPGMVANWMKLATQLNAEADGLDVSLLTEHRRRYLETIRDDQS